MYCLNDLDRYLEERIEYWKNKYLDLYYYSQRGDDQECYGYWQAYEDIKKKLKKIGEPRGE